MAERAEVVADSEDGIQWYKRTCSRRAARAEAASMAMEGRWRFKVSPRFMRPASVADCDARVHVDQDEDAEDCTCWQIEEGWHTECAADHPDAFPVWRVEWRDAPAWVYRLRRRLRLLHPATHRTGKPAPLWGWKPPRRARWFDRLLLGRAYVLVAGHLHVWLNRGEVRWCDGCRGDTLHGLGRNGHAYCDARDHWDRSERGRG
jgi:hypothetical protein